MLRHAGCHPPLNGFSPVFSKRTEPESLLSSAFFPHLFWQILVTGSFYGHEIYRHKRYVVKSVEQKKKKGKCLIITYLRPQARINLKFQSNLR